MIPFAQVVRYLWHFFSLLSGRGAAAEFRSGGGSGLALPWIVFRAHIAAAGSLPRLLRKRRQIRQTAYLNPKQFSRLLSRHSISLREVASL
jgi:hypothetical protein